MRICFFLVLQGLLVAAAPVVRADDSPHMLLGNPSAANDDKNNLLMTKKFFALSYNSDKGTPNWVSWTLAQADLGEAARKRTFDTDQDLPPAVKAVVHKDYVGSGFDRGHMCPHSDRAATEESSFATFVMTNVIPQAPNVNQKAWNELEAYARSLVEKGKHHLYIVSGPAGKGGKGKNGMKLTIANGKVTVPSACWKIIVVLDGEKAGPEDLAKITKETRVIAVLMPNDNSVGFEWEGFRTSVAEIEKETGLKFFDKVPNAVADDLKQDADEEHIPASIPIVHHN